MEANHVDPYAPPKAALTGTDNTTYLKHDGYAFHNELIANQHFKSPLICAKLGIPIPPESSPEPKLIKVTRVPTGSQLLGFIVTVLTIFALVIFSSYLEYFSITTGIIAYIAYSYFFKYIFTKPYKIPFYFSEQYTRLRRNRLLTFCATFIILASIAAYGIITHHDESIVFVAIATVITFIIYKLKTTKFVVTQTKGDFHYIRGVHPKLLRALPHLPLSS